MQDTVTTTHGLISIWEPRAESSSGSLLDRILAARGFTNPTDIESFLNPSLANLHDPSLIPDLDKAAQLILTAAKAQDPIVIYADYDVDGTSAAAILYRTIQALTPNAPISTYIPHRIKEGYGVHPDAITHLADQGAKVIITVDCGICAHAAVARARQCGVRIVVTDHHNPPKKITDLPDADAVVHPRRPDSEYPFGDLCGAGVAYKLAWRLATLHSGSDRASETMRRLLVELLGYAALGTVADVVPLVGENRVIARYGLARLKHSPFVGIRALVEASGLAGERIAAEDVGFRLGPRLNAAGRMGHARDTYELLTSDDSERCDELAAMLTGLNIERRALEKRIFEQAVEMAEAGGITGEDRRAIVLHHQDWHVGVLGIVCSRMMYRYCRPVILMASEDGWCKGSGRSIEGFNLHAGLEACAEFLDSYGGHDMAAGMRVSEDRVEAFTGAFLDHTNATLEVGDLVKRTSYDTLVELGELTPEAVGTLESLGPFGAGNPGVRVRIDGLRVDEAPKSFGKAGDHAGLRVGSDGGQSVRGVRVVGWGWADRLREIGIKRGSTIEMIVEPKVSSWNGRVSVEPTLVDLRIAE